MTIMLVANVDADRCTPPTADDGRPIEVADRPAPMAIRLRRPPASEPPYDTAVTDTAARDAVVRGAAPPNAALLDARDGSATPAASSRDLVVSAANRDVTASGNAGTSGRRTHASGAAARDRPMSPAPSLPSPTAAAVRYVRTCLEVLNGFRPATHLRTLPGSVEFAAVVSQLSRRRNGRGHFPQAVTAPTRDRQTIATTAISAGQFTTSPRSKPPINASRHGGSSQASAPTSVASPVEQSRRPGAGGRVAGNTTASRYSTPVAGSESVLRSGGHPAQPQRNAAGAAHPFRLQRMRLDEPRDGVAEAVAVLSYARSSLAMALRLERHDGQWVCVLVQVI